MVFTFNPQHRFPVPERPQFPAAGFQQPTFRGGFPQQLPRGFQQVQQGFPQVQQRWTGRGWVNAPVPVVTPAPVYLPIGVDSGWGSFQWAKGTAPATHAPLPQTIPIRVAGLVATHLSSEHAFATLSNLNVTSREIHEATLRDLYGTVYLNWSGNANSRKREEGWDVDWTAVEKWRKKRWDDRLESAKGSPHIDFLLGPPMHRHFFVAWENRKNWIPEGLVDTLKAAVTYKIDATIGSCVKPNDKLEVFLCGKYRFGKDDVVRLLDAIEPPMQDVSEPLESSDKTFYTRLVVLLDMTHYDPIRWHAKQNQQLTHLESRSYPWLRYIDLVICTPEEFDADHLAVVMTEGLTMIKPAVKAWWSGDDDARPELVVKGINVEMARTCAGLFAQAIEDDNEYSCIEFKLLGTDLAHNLDLTASLYILHPLRSAYVSLEGNVPFTSIGSASAGDLDAADREEGVARDVCACVRVDGREVQVLFEEGGEVHRECTPAVKEPSWGDY